MSPKRGLAILVVVCSLLSFSSAAVADEAGTGTITGTATAEGFGSVQVNLHDSSGAFVAQTRTIFNQTYTFADVPAGSYKLQFIFTTGRPQLQIRQWAHQKRDLQTADTFVVTANETTVVDETMLEPGAIEVHATDSATGAPVDNFCAALFDVFLPDNCGGVAGVLRITRVSEGVHSVVLRSTDGLHLRQQVDGVAVSLGETTRVDVSFAPSAAITTTVVDRTTGEPVSDVCVAALLLRLGAISEDICEFFVNTSDEAGRVLIGELAAGQYTLLALPLPDGRYGIQWVGSKGGVGSQYAAVRVNAVVGQQSAAPPIRLDPDAMISGVIRESVAHAPVGGACASILPIWQFRTAPAGTESCTQDDGVYLLSQLGPYEWPLLFRHSFDTSFAPVWSGGATDRTAADPVRAKVGNPGKADATLRREDGGLTGTITQASGEPQTDSTAFRLYNDRTGDLVSERTVQGGSYTVRGFAEQVLHVWFAAFPAPGVWYGGTNEATAAGIRIKGDRLTTLDLVAPPLS